MVSSPGLARNISGCFVAFAVTCLLSGCSTKYLTKEYNRIHYAMSLSSSHNIERSSQWRLSETTSVMLVKPRFPYKVTSGATDYPRSRYALLKALERAFVEYFPNTQIVNDELSRNDALITAQLMGCRVVVYPQLLDISDVRNTSEVAEAKSIGSDATRVQILILDTLTGQVIDKATVKSRSSWASAEQSPAQDLFADAAITYVDGIVGKL